MSKTKLKKHLISLTKEQLVDLVINLYGASKEANKWLEFYLEPNSDAELEKFKKNIRNQFFTRNDFPKDPNFRECNKLITTFKKLVNDPVTVADLMLYYVEQGCNLTAEFGDCDSSFYTALENNFYKACKYISDNGLMTEFSSRMKEMIGTVMCCGYGFSDHLWEIYYDYADE